MAIHQPPALSCQCVMSSLPNKKGGDRANANVLSETKTEGTVRELKLLEGRCCEGVSPRSNRKSDKPKLLYKTHTFIYSVFVAFLLSSRHW